MGRMKEIFVIMQDDGMRDLDKSIKKAVRLNSDLINFRGRTYSIIDAKKLLIFMKNEDDKIRRSNEFAERGPVSND